MPSYRLTAAVVGGVLAFSSHAVPFGSWNTDVASWNIAAVNNNPFEYWVSYDNPAYVKLMDDVQDFVSEPGARDITVKEVFTEEMFV